jgi:hypothetical protein
LGQHYVVDAVIGFAYALAGYVLVMHVAPALQRWARRDRELTTHPRMGARPELEEV